MVKNNIPSIAAIISHPPQRTTSSPVFVGEEGENDSDDDQYDTPWEFHRHNHGSIATVLLQKQQTEAICKAQLASKKSSVKAMFPLIKPTHTCVGSARGLSDISKPLSHCLRHGSQSQTAGRKKRMSLETLRPFQQRTNEQDDRKKSSKKTKSARLTTPKDATVVFAAAESDLSSIHTPNTTQETEDQAPASTVRPMPTRPNKLLPTPTNILNTERFSLSPPLLLPAPSPSSGRIGAPYPITRTTPMGSHKTRPLHWSPLVSFSDPMSPHCSVRKKEESSSTSSSTQARAKNTLAMDNKSMPARHDQPEEEIIDFNKEFTSSSESPLEAFTLDRSKSEALLTPTGVGTFLLRRRTGHSGANNGNEYLALSLRATGGVLHIKLEKRCNDGLWVLGEGPKFASIDSMLRAYRASELPVHGAEHIRLGEAFRFPTTPAN